jgi:hypothetical protein
MDVKHIAKIEKELLAIVKAGINFRTFEHEVILIS